VEKINVKCSQLRWAVPNWGRWQTRAQSPGAGARRPDFQIWVSCFHSYWNDGGL